MTRILRRAAAILAILLPTALHATQDGWPALFDVTGVAEDDVLNMRAAPDPSSEILGTLPHNARDIEVIIPNDQQTWGLINMRERSGWVSLNYMARQPGHLDGLFPGYTSCSGTEPFWSLERAEGTLTLDVAFDDRPAVAELIEWETGTLNHRGRFSFATPGMVGVIARQSCNDGMSDREYGLEINLILRGEETHLQGCCSIQPRAR